MEALTATERELIELLGQVANKFNAVSQHDPGTGPEDTREAIHHIHALQSMVMANAAARAYPELYRLHGGPRADGGKG